MSKRKLSPTQVGFIVILWVALVAYILMYAEITAFTVITILMSAAIVFIPIYKNFRK